MNSIYKNNNVRKFWLSLSLIGMVTLGIFVQGCTKDFDDGNKLDAENLYNMDTKYLDFDVNSYVAFTPEELNMLATAVQRAAKYLVFDGEKYVLELESGSEINISDRLFDYIYPSMLNVQPTANIPRLKQGSELIVDSWGTEYATHLTHQQTLQLMQQMNNAINVMGWSVGVAVTYVTRNLGNGSVVFGVSAGTLTAISGADWSGMYNNYVNSGSTKGVIFHQYNMNVGIGVMQTYKITIKI